MPPKKAQGKSKRKGNRKPKGMVFKPFNPAPVNLKLRYSQHFDLVSGAGLLGVQQFRMNSIFDPDYTGVGHQPMGHDELSLRYEKYIVLGCKIQIKCKSTNPGTVVLGSSNLTVAPSTSDQAIERGYKYKNVFNETLATMSQNFRMSKQIGKSNAALLAENAYAAAFGANPTESSFINIGFIRDDGTSGSICHVECLLEYDVRCYDPLPLSQS